MLRSFGSAVRVVPVSLRVRPWRGAIAIRPSAAPLWFLAAIAPMLASEIVRLSQADPLTWIAWDYAGRIAALAVLAASPAARRAAFSRQQVGISWWEVAVWIIGLVAFDRIVDHAVFATVDAMIPGTRLGQFPSGSGWLFAVDISFGLALVAWCEEVIFRRCAREVLSGLVGDGPAMVIISALLFASWHWWTGIGNIAATMLFGVMAMLCYRRAGSLSPVVLAHYLCDVANFS
jgi:uncharacterized protein